MIPGFEDYTYDLTAAEIKAIPKVIGLLVKIEKKNIISAEKLLIEVNKLLPKPLRPERLRAIINYICGTSQLPVHSTQKGYYVSYNLAEIAKQCKSLDGRAAAIKWRSDGLRRFLPEKKGFKTLESCK